MEVDVLIVGDFRFPGGTSTAIISEVRALASSGYCVGLLALSSGPLPNRRGFHPGIDCLVAEGSAVLIPQGEQVTAQLCCLHHPSVFETLPAAPIDIDCAKFVLIVHHPPIDAFGLRQYDVAKIVHITSELFGPVVWAPVGPKVRQAFSNVDAAPPLTMEDWHNIIDIDEFRVARQRLPGVVPVVGRHSRPEANKWPDNRETFLGAYPDDPSVHVRLMGYGSALDEIVDDRPANWDVIPFNGMPVPDFLGSLTYFSYFHSEEWIEAFGRSILEAMASGLVCFLPHSFEPLFGDAAVYCEPTDVLEQVWHFEENPDEYVAQTNRAFAVLRQRFGPRTAVDRVRALIGAPVASQPAVAKKRPSVLYFTSNGVGMGHITRCMATARRLDVDCQTTIVTMSKAFGVARDQGMNVEYVPFFRSIGIEHGTWTKKLSNELTQILQYYKPDVFVFDGNVPYDGLYTVLNRFPDMWRVWQRRALWRPGVGKEYLARTQYFDVVLEPGELADPVDRGRTKNRQAEALCVPSIRFLDADEAMGRQAARNLLGLDADRPAALLQLGSGNNFNFREVLDMLCEISDPKTGTKDLQLVFAQWQIAQNPVELPGHVKVLDAFPIARYLQAFDCAVAFAGYNTFHENIAAGLPTLFSSNDHPEQDEQWLRGDYAALRGLALSARTTDRFHFRRQLMKILDPDVQSRLRSACLRLDAENGADAAARFIQNLAYTRKRSRLAFRPPAAAVR